MGLVRLGLGWWRVDSRIPTGAEKLVPNDDPTDDWQCERGSSFPTRWQQLGGIAATERATNCASRETFFWSEFNFFFRGTKICALCLGWLISKFQIGIPTSSFFHGTKIGDCLGAVDQQVSDRNSNFFSHGTKIRWLLGFVDQQARGNGGGVGKLWEAAACVG